MLFCSPATWLNAHFSGLIESMLQIAHLIASYQCDRNKWSNIFWASVSFKLVYVPLKGDYDPEYHHTCR